jgi:hypothetical protein
VTRKGPLSFQAFYDKIALSPKRISDKSGKLFEMSPSQGLNFPYCDPITKFDRESRVLEWDCRKELRKLQNGLLRE